VIFFLQALAVGIIKGAIYVVIALSMAIIYKSSRVFNFAVGEFCAMGAMFFLAASSLGLPVILAFSLFILLCMIGGGIVEKIVIQPLMGRDPLSITLVTIGLSIFLIGFFAIVFGSTPRALKVDLPDLTVAELGGLFFTSEQVWSAILAVTSIFALMAFYRFTRWGIAMRATAEGQVQAMAFGIDTRFILTLTWVISAVIAGLAGLSVAWTGSVQYNMGIVGLLAIPVLLVAGLESIGGCIIGGIIVGIVESLTIFYFESFFGLPGLRSVTPYIFLLVVLMIRPTGLFGQVNIERV
jgi:branched-chain amino acid transport system permease protein